MKTIISMFKGLRWRFVFVLFGWAACSCIGGIQYDAGTGTWRLASGPIEYRLQRQGDSVYLDYFGPANQPDAKHDSDAAGLSRSWNASANAGWIEGQRVAAKDLYLVEHRILPIESGISKLQLVFKHPGSSMAVIVVYSTCDDTGVLTRQVTLINQGKRTCRIDAWPSLSWQLPGADYVLNYLHGSWGHERQLAAEALTTQREFINRKGRSSNGHSAWFSLLNEKGCVRYLAQLAYSGNWQMQFRPASGDTESEQDRLQAELGMRFDFGGPLALKPDQSIELPAVAFTASTGDLDDAANQMHRYQRRFVIPRAPANDPLLVQFNSWYPFPGKMTIEEMKRCADIAAELGTEVFVLDAGWFNKTSWDRELGDWQSDPVAFPNGLQELASFVHDNGLKFGIWVEIENVGIESQTFREHPDWCLTYNGQPIVGNSRHQLDFANPEVRNWARNVIGRLMDSCKLDWIKIDYNIDIGDAFDPLDSEPRGDRLYQHLTGYYAWLDELRAAYPNLVIENCSSGGMRFDLGIIGHTHTTWLSDEILPVPSLQLAYGSTIEFAPEICNHWMVGDQHNGSVDMSKPAGWWDFMFRVPMNGQFGLSSRVFDWRPELRQRAAENIALYKQLRKVIQNADVYHLTPQPDHSSPTGWMAIQYVAPNQQKSVLMTYRLAQSQPEQVLKLRGLDANRNYCVRQAEQSAQVFTGAHLAQNGLLVKLDEEWRSAVFELESEPKTIILDGHKTDRIFEGIGALSAGASSRLLIDYEEPYRSQILDLLFKPNFGAAFQHLKVEIGGDVNSTDGCEPSHKHTRHDENFNRGYEWWLMKQAKQCNPNLFLDCLEWGAPAWIGNGNFYSQDNADYVASFVKGAKTAHNLDIDFVGVWNETRYDSGWIKLLRQTLDRNGFSQVKIVAADEINQWSVVDVMKTDKELAEAIHAVGVHYPKFKSSPAAKSCGKPIWSSEDGPWKGAWEGARALAKTYNRNYIEGKMTKTIIWSPVTSYYDSLPLPGSGVMKANTPWSGAFEVQPALWATAHTTQFAQPGWAYLANDSCGFLPLGGSYVTLKSSNNSDFSIVVETIDATNSQEIVFILEVGLSTSRLNVWRTDASEQFVRQPEITPFNGMFRITFDKECIYSLTTATGQHKGAVSSPPHAPFPVPYFDDFESYRKGRTPRFLSDQAGIFEVSKRKDGKGKCLRQVVKRKGIEWHYHLNPCPETIWGSTEWTNYELSADVLIEKAGFVSLFGRVGTVPQNAELPNGYWLKVADTGYWELGTAKIPIASGKVSFPADVWHHVQLRFLDNTVGILINGELVATVANDTYRAGMAGIGCGWHTAQFDNLSIKPLATEEHDEK